LIPISVMVTTGPYCESDREARRATRLGAAGFPSTAA
jgi:hypothetical protein